LKIEIPIGEQILNRV